MPDFALVGPSRLALQGALSVSGQIGYTLAPQPVVTSAELTGSAAANTLQGQAYTVTLKDQFGAPINTTQTYTITWTQTGNATLNPASSVIAAGSSSASTTATWPNAGNGSIDFAISPTVPKSNTPLNVSINDNGAQDFSTRIASSSVVWWHDFSTPRQITEFQNGLDSSVTLPMLRVVNDGGPCLEQIWLGARLAQAYTAGGTSMVIDDATYWPDPAVVGPYPVQAARQYPSLGLKNAFTVTAIAYNTPSGNQATLTVAYNAALTTGYSWMAQTPQSFPVGSVIGNQSANWERPFMALPSGENGQLVNDPAAAGVVPIRSRLPNNQYSVPFSPTIGPLYGYYGPSSYQTLWQSWTPRIASNTYTPMGVVNGSDSKFRLWDGTSFYIQYKIKIDPRFFTNELAPYGDGTNAGIGRKAIGIDSGKSTRTQVLLSYGRSDDKYLIPSITDRSIFTFMSHKAERVVGSTDYARPTNYALPNHRSHQPGSPWDVSPHYADLQTLGPNGTGLPGTGLPTPDGAAAYKIAGGEWVTVHISVTPGRSQTAESSFKVEIARTEHPSYASAYTTIIDLDDFRAVYSNSDSDDSGSYNPDGTFPSLSGTQDVLPGYQELTLFGYFNIWQNDQTRPASVSSYFRLKELIFSRAPIAPPPRDFRPAYVPSTPNSWLRHVAGGGVLTNSWYSQVAPYYEPFYAARLSLFAGGRLNRWWGHFGALMGVGGGHAATNDNSVWALTFNSDGATMTFRRLTDPPHYFTDPNNPSTWTQTNRESNAGWSGAPPVYDDQTYGEVLIGGPQGTGVQQIGVPSAPHSCDALDIIGPAHGGGKYGSLQLVARFACTYGGDSNLPNGRRTWVTPHHIKFDTLAATPGNYTWQRTANDNRNAMSREGGYSSRFVPTQGRIYVQAGAKSPHGPVWFDLATKAYVDGTGSARAAAPGGVAFASVYVPERDLLLWFYQTAGSGQVGTLRVDTLPVGVNDTNPSWTQNRPLSASLPISADTGIVVCWCPPIQKLILGNVHNDPNCVYEITIPTNLSSTWNCERVAFTPPAPLFTMPWQGNERYSIGWEWNERIGAIVYLPDIRNDGGPDAVYVYRPRGT